MTDQRLENCQLTKNVLFADIIVLSLVRILSNNIIN